jgi:hypothetical protein
MARRSALRARREAPAVLDVYRSPPGWHYRDVREEREREITEEMIARRAFELWLTNGSASPEENWYLAEQELREEAARQRRRRDQA